MVGHNSETGIGMG